MVFTQLMSQLSEARKTADANISVCHSELSEKFVDDKGVVPQDALVCQFLLKKVDETVGELFSVMETSLDACVKLDKESIDARNALVDLGRVSEELEREKMRRQQATKVMKIERDNAIALGVRVKELEALLSQRETELENLKTKTKNDKAQLGELASLRKLNPHKMLQDHEKEVKKYERKQDKINNQLEESKSLVAKQKEQIVGLQDELDSRFGKVLLDGVMGQDGVKYRLSYYNFPTDHRMQMTDDLSPIINDFNWHLKVSCSLGLSVNVSLNACLEPVLPYCEEMKQTWPDNFSDQLREKALEVVKSRSPEIMYVRREARNLVISTHETFTDVEQNALKKSKYLTLLEVVSVDRSRLIDDLAKCVDREVAVGMLVKVKGIYLNMIDGLQKSVDAGTLRDIDVTETI
ncbi:hypothetical protein ACP3V3_16770 [Vibrio sp. PNB22_3_1]